MSCVLNVSCTTTPAFDGAVADARCSAHESPCGPRAKSALRLCCFASESTAAAAGARSSDKRATARKGTAHRHGKHAGRRRAAPARNRAGARARFRRRGRRNGRAARPRGVGGGRRDRAGARARGRLGGARLRGGRLGHRPDETRASALTARRRRLVGLCGLSCAATASGALKPRAAMLRCAACMQAAARGASVAVAHRDEPVRAQTDADGPKDPARHGATAPGVADYYRMAARNGCNRIGGSPDMPCRNRW